uniref:palmitoyl-protein hydrolase n=1 Tax=Anas platyrhynchos platyrhynchos TaxID=8840 RepID=U3IWM9_ANAPP
MCSCSIGEGGRDRARGAPALPCTVAVSDGVGSAPAPPPHGAAEGLGVSLQAAEPNASGRASRNSRQLPGIRLDSWQGAARAWGGDGDPPWLGWARGSCSPSWWYTVLFSHGNAVDLGQMSSFYIGLGTRINCNIFSYDYSGYGASTGKPSERNLYSDIDAAWQALRTRYGISPENIILYGQSIGTVPTVDLASRYECAAIVLHSPLTSGMRVAFPETKKTYWFDAFPNIEKISKITSPVLIIHGTEDEVIDFSHGLALFERCPKAVEPLWVDGAGHNDIELYSQYLERLRKFISQELASQRN